jgi:hypothetical protein
MNQREERIESFVKILQAYAYVVTRDKYNTIINHLISAGNIDMRDDL